MDSSGQRQGEGESSKPSSNWRRTIAKVLNRTKSALKRDGIERNSSGQDVAADAGSSR